MYIMITVILICVILHYFQGFLLLFATIVCEPISGTWNGERVTHVYAQATRAAKSPLGICDGCLRQRSLHPGG